MSAEGRLSLNDSLERRRRVSFAASVVLHVVLVFLVALFLPALFRQKPRPKVVVEVKQILRLETKLKPKPVIARRVPTPSSVIPIRRPQPEVATIPVPTLPVPHELSKPKYTLHLPPAPAVVKHPVQPATQGKPLLSEQRIAQIQGDLASDIAKDRSGIDPLHVPPGAAPDVKHYGPDFATLGTSSMRHHGLCDPVSNWKEGSWNYYYVVCNVSFSDGSSARQGVPWPVRFAPSDDPFTGTAHDQRPLAMPLPGWHLGPGQSISVELREYAHEHGVDL